MPPKYFLESSAFIKRYKSEDGTDFIDWIFRNFPNDIHCINLTIVEINKVFHRLRHNPQGQGANIEPQINQEIFEKMQSAFARDLQSINIIQLTQAMVNRSLDILEVGWVPSSIDVIQLAALLEMKEAYTNVKFVCSDEKLNEIAVQLIPPGDVIDPANQTSVVILERQRVETSQRILATIA